MLYPQLDDEALDALAEALLATIGERPARGAAPWSEQDVVLIVYGDSITAPGERPLVTLERTLAERFADVISTVHVLPFFPFTSDDGFAVTDHCAVAEHLGTEADVGALTSCFKLMADLIVNHISFEHRWVHQFLADLEPGRRLLRTIDEHEDLTHVTRPRTSPLGRKVRTAAGPRELWCTFSHDQVDLDYREPDTLVELVRVVGWLLDVGASWLRLDAVAYVWDESGTSCVHLPQTHEIVKLLRTLADGRAPGTVVVTETNVPHEDNVSYFGDGDEAHVVYNFTLPPLLAYALLTGSSAPLHRWLDNLDGPPAGCAVLNFLASHDGIGLRPAEGLLDDEQIATLVAASHAAGGCHSEYSTQNGTRPYEINVSLFDLLAPEREPHGVERYLAAHTVMLALAGVPAFYLHGILGTPNSRPREPVADDAEGDPAQRHPPTSMPRLPPPMPTSVARQLNRRKLTADELAELAQRPGGVFDEIKRRTVIRRRHGAFHPNSAQASRFVDERVVSFVRGEPGASATQAPPVWCVTNVTNQDVVLRGAARALRGDLIDLLSDARCADGEPVKLAPYASLWLTRCFE